jgi:predicted nucleic acid-binding protein
VGKVKAVIDSDILIDYLQGVEKARKEIKLYSQQCISMVSWMEVMCGAEGEEEEIKCRDFLARFEVFEIGQAIAEKAVRIRREHSIKLPDAIIWATAQEQGCLLVTRNTKDFPHNHPGVRFPYRVD